MAVTVYAATSITASATEKFLSSPNAAASYVIHVDNGNMVAGDVVELRIYKTIHATTSAYVAYYGRFEGAPPTDDRVAVSVPITNASTMTNAVRFSLKQTGGSTFKAFRYEILKIA